MADPRFRDQTLQRLAEQLRRLERSCRRPQKTDALLSTGVPPLDALLPDGGVREGSLIEWLMQGEGSGGGTLAFLTAAGLLQSQQGALIVIDPQREFYPPAAALLGIDLDRTVVVRPRRTHDALWALEQSLGCRGVAVVAGWFGHLNDRTFRRLQLAAEAGRTVGLLLRAARYRAAPSWADVRLGVHPLGSDSLPVVSQSANRQTAQRGRGVQIELLSYRGRMDGGTIELEIDDETGDVHLASRLAPAENPERETGT